MHVCLCALSAKPSLSLKVHYLNDCSCVASFLILLFIISSCSVLRKIEVMARCQNAVTKNRRFRCLPGEGCVCKGHRAETEKECVAAKMGNSVA